jgi:phospholipid/cholesterol/gamma-HCH transport system substrate-binding protein
MPSVERVQWAKTRVSAVSAAALMILGTLLYLLTGGTLFEPKSTLYLYMPDAVALVAGAPVRVDGIGVGKVESVELSGMTQPGRVVKVTMLIERDRMASIPDDSTAEASADTLVGDKFVDITSGSSPSRIKAGGEMIFKPQPDLMKRLDITEFENRMREVDALLTDIETGKSPLGQFVKGDEMYRHLRRRVADLQAGIRAVADRTGEVAQAFNSDAVYRKVSEPIRGLDASLARIQSGQGALGQFLRDDAQYLQLRNSVAEVRKSMAGLRGGAFMTSDQQYQDWNRSVQSMIRMVDEFAANPMLATTATYDNLNGMAKELRSTVKDFRENPRKYLRLKVF